MHRELYLNFFVGFVVKLHATLLFTACFLARAEDYEINAENDEIQLKMVTEEQAAKITKK
jgi:hypothetical protein